MRHFVLEETYELLEAIEGDDDGALAEELGDVMFHLAFQVHMAKEEGRFDEAAVFQSVIDKLVRRHPHVFGDTRATGAREVLDNWQDLKRAEKGEDDEGIDPRRRPESPCPRWRRPTPSSSAPRASGSTGRTPPESSTRWPRSSPSLAAVEDEAEREQEMGDLLFSRRQRGPVDGHRRRGGAEGGR